MCRLRLALVLALAASAAACGTVPTLPGVSPYRMEIQQGNYITQEMVSQLKPGMTREQVRFILGTPLVADIFHADRWDYPYFRDVPGKPREHRRFSVFFEDGKLARVSGDIVPAGTAAEPPAAKPAATRPAAAAERAPPAASPAPDAVAPAGQNWKAASDDPDYGKSSEPAEPEKKPAADAPAERGFFGRMIDRIRGNE